MQASNRAPVTNVSWKLKVKKYDQTSRKLKPIHSIWTLIILPTLNEMKPKTANKTLKWFCHIWRCLLCLKDEQTIISRTVEGKGPWQNNFSVKKLKIVWPHLSAAIKAYLNMVSLLASLNWGVQLQRRADKTHSRIKVIFKGLLSNSLS
jgi:hypothetical protein